MHKLADAGWRLLPSRAPTAGRGSMSRPSAYTPVADYRSRARPTGAAVYPLRAAGGRANRSRRI